MVAESAKPDGGGKSTKRWFTMQMWRVQQVSQVLTLALLAVNLAIEMYGLMKWRPWPFDNPYVAVPLVLLIILIAIWAFALIWDLRMKMWRVQQSVLMEKNPYGKEKLYSKEMMMMAVTWLPVMDKLGRDDPKIKAGADSLRAWIRKELEGDPYLRKDWQELRVFLDDLPPEP